MVDLERNYAPLLEGGVRWKNNIMRVQVQSHGFMTGQDVIVESLGLSKLFLVFTGMSDPSCGMVNCDSSFISLSSPLVDKSNRVPLRTQ